MTLYNNPLFGQGLSSLIESLLTNNPRMPSGPIGTATRSQGGRLTVPANSRAAQTLATSGGLGDMVLKVSEAGVPINPDSSFTLPGDGYFPAVARGSERTKEPRSYGHAEGGAPVPPGQGGAGGGPYGSGSIPRAAPLEGDWYQYKNQGAIRNDPLSAKLIEAMDFLPGMGIEMNVTSGGQEAHGEGGNRTGSTRHDHGNAFDGYFTRDGRKLDWNNADDVPVLQEIVRRARSVGVTGFGAGNDYMGPGQMHVGYGTPGVWGAEGRGVNAPAWLTEAFTAGGAPFVSSRPQARPEASTPASAPLAPASVPTMPPAPTLDVLPLAIPAAPAPILRVGQIVDGYRYTGGDPNDRNNWIPAQ